MRIRRRTLNLLIAVDVPAAILIVLGIIIGPHSSGAGIALGVAAGVLIAIGWSITLFGRRPTNSGFIRDTTRPGIKVVERE
jgi:hypothetical protein